MTVVFQNFKISNEDSITKFEWHWLQIIKINNKKVWWQLSILATFNFGDFQFNSSKIPTFSNKYWNQGNIANFHLWLEEIPFSACMDLAIKNRVCTFEIVTLLNSFYFSESLKESWGYVNFTIVLFAVKSHIVFDIFDVRICSPSNCSYFFIKSRIFKRWPIYYA